MPNRSLIAYLMLIEANAASLRQKIEGGGTWPGEATAALDAISKALEDARREVGYDR